MVAVSLVLMEPRGRFITAPIPGFQQFYQRNLQLKPTAQNGSRQWKLVSSALMNHVDDPQRIQFLDYHPMRLELSAIETNGTKWFGTTVGNVGRFDEAIGRFTIRRIPGCQIVLSIQLQLKATAQNG